MAGKTRATLHTLRPSNLALYDQGRPGAYVYATRTHHDVLQRKLTRLLRRSVWSTRARNSMTRTAPAARTDATYHRPGLHLYHRNGKELVGLVALAHAIHCHVRRKGEPDQIATQLRRVPSFAMSGRISPAAESP